MAGMSRWLEETGGARGSSYDEAFRELAEQGVDVHGEAAYADALLPPRSRVLDAGCGTGRVALELARRGHLVTGVDNDPSMLAVARSRPGVRWLERDLAGLDLGEPFDLVLAAGNVVVFLTPGTEPRHRAARVAPGARRPAGQRLADRPPRAPGVRQVGRRRRAGSGGPAQHLAGGAVGGGGRLVRRGGPRGGDSGGPRGGDSGGPRGGDSGGPRGAMIS